MHEFGLVEAIVQTAEAKAGGRPLKRIRVRLSVMLRAEEDSMQQAFSMLSTGTSLDGAELELVQVPGSGACASCAKEIEVSDPLEPCPECGEHAVSVSNAEEMILEEIEYRPQAEVT